MFSEEKRLQWIREIYKDDTKTAQDLTKYILESREEQTKETIKYTPKDVECLTKNIYYEAGIEDRIGKYAVANITINRIKSGYWGKDVCQVVYAKKQFSWTLKKQLPKPNQKLWQESQSIALAVLSGARVRGLTRSLYYHANYIRHPYWVDTTEHVLTIGRHIFYNRAKNSKVYI